MSAEPSRRVEKVVAYSRLFLDRLPSLKAPEAPGGSRASLVGQHVVVVLDDIRVLRRVDQRVVLIGGLLAVFAPAEPAGSLEVHVRPVPGASKREQALQGSPQGSGRRRSSRRNRTGRSCGTSAATRRCRMPGGSDANHSRVRSVDRPPGRVSAPQPVPDPHDLAASAAGACGVILHGAGLWAVLPDAAEWGKLRG